MAGSADTNHHPDPPAAQAQPCERYGVLRTDGPQQYMCMVGAKHSSDAMLLSKKGCFNGQRMLHRVTCKPLKQTLYAPTTLSDALDGQALVRERG